MSTPEQSGSTSFQIDLSGRTALVTGAASGIGAACAGRLAADGVHVIAVDYDEAGLRGAAGTEIETLACDLADLDGLGALPTDVDILVNNAGVQQVAPIAAVPAGAVHLHPAADARVAVPPDPARAPAHVRRRLGPGGQHQLGAHGLRASPFKSAYVAAKHGLEGLSKVVALEGAAHGVTSNCVNPAYVRTPLVEKQLADQADPRPPRGRGAGQGAARAGRGEAADRAGRSGGAGRVAVRPGLRLHHGESFVLDGGWTAR